MIIQTKKTKEFLEQLQIDSKLSQCNSILRCGSTQGIRHHYHNHTSNNNRSFGENQMVDGVKTVRFPFIVDQNSNIAVRSNSSGRLLDEIIDNQDNIEDSIQITLKNVKSAIRPEIHNPNSINQNKSSLTVNKSFGQHNSQVRSFSPVSTAKQRDYLEKRVEQEACKIVNSLAKKRHAESPLRKLHVPPESLLIFKQQQQSQQQQQHQFSYNDQQLYSFPHLKNAIEIEQNVLTIRGREKQQIIGKILESNQSLERLKTKLEEEQKRQIRTARSVERTQNNRRNEREQLARPPSSEQHEFTRMINQFDAEKASSRERLHERISALTVNQQRQNIWRMHGL